jgi:hypothetical protein
MRVAAELAVLARPFRPGVKAPWRRKRHDGRLEALRGRAQASDASGPPPPNVIGRPPEERQHAPEAPPAAAKRPQSGQNRRRKRRERHARPSGPPSRPRPADPRVLRPGRVPRERHPVSIARVGSFAKSRKAFRRHHRALTSTAVPQPHAAGAASYRRRAANTTRSAPI